SIPLLLTELGLVTLSQFCETLLLLEKASYAAVGWRVCASLYRSQQRMQKYVDILSKVRAVSAERLDRRRAILIYRDILEYYVSQNKTNEVISYIIIHIGIYGYIYIRIFL